MTGRTRLLAWIYIVLCGGCLAIGTVLCVGLLFSRDDRSANALAFIGGLFASLSACFFVPGLIGGVGLLRGRPWARIVIIILSLLIILAIPVGTALGGFGLWVLLGKDAKAFQDAAGARAPAADVPHASPWRVPTMRSAERARIGGVLIAAAGVGAGFVVFIGTGYRVTHTPGSPIGSVAYVVAIVVLLLTVGMGVRRLFGRGVRTQQWRGRQELDEERLRSDEARRERLDALARDPVRRVYVERIERGESWSDAQVEYDLNAAQLATCVHLNPIEREMRASGIDVRLRLALHVSARCCIDAGLLRTRFALPAFVEYSEPQPTGRAFEDPLPALIACNECQSAIDVVHRADATSDTPMFPASPASPQSEAPVADDVATDRFTQLRSRILPLAQAIDAPPYSLPTYHWSAGTGLPHIEITGDTYHYVVEERGQEFERFSTTSVDELLYRIFRDIAFTMAASPARSRQIPGQDFRREMFRQQLLLLARLNPDWASRCAAEHEEVLIAHPFVDKL